MAAMLKGVLSRKVAMLIGVVLAGQLLAGLLVQVWVIGPQTARLADVTADMISGLSASMTDLPPDRRARVVAGLNRGQHLLVRPIDEPPLEGRRFPSYIEYKFMRALAARLTTQHRLDWITDTGDRLWIRLALGRDEYWVSVTPPRRRSAMTSLLAAFGAAFFVAAIAGLSLQRRLDRPLRRLAAAVDDFVPDRMASSVPVEGSEEVAAVANAFNRLTRRFADNEADRALMLGGVSHDLRTPLTRLRLSLEMIRSPDAELKAIAIRQVDRIEAMLVQFLDFARGFETESAERVDVAMLLRGIAAEVATEAVTLDLSDNLVIQTRPHALSRAVTNLLVNALRHGEPPFGLAASRHDNLIRIVVRDGGSGMTPQSVEHLLKPFARGDGARGGDGAGLGLAIAERAIHAVDGRLQFERSANGFTAIIDLPVTPPAEGWIGRA